MLRDEREEGEEGEEGEESMPRTVSAILSSFHCINCFRIDFIS